MFKSKFLWQYSSNSIVPTNCVALHPFSYSLHLISSNMNWFSFSLLSFVWVTKKRENHQENLFYTHLSGPWDGG